MSALVAVSIMMTSVAQIPVEYPFAQPILNTSSSFGHLGMGNITGFEFPKMGALGTEVLFMGSFQNDQSALMVFDAQGYGRVDSIFNPLKYLGFGGHHIASGISDTRHRLLAYVVELDSDTMFNPGQRKQLHSVVLHIADLSTITIATTGQLFKPANVTLSSFTAPRIAASADGKEAYVVFQAWGDGNRWQGIIHAKVTFDVAHADVIPELTIVADSNTVIPGTLKHSPTRFGCLGSQAVSDAGDVVFFGSNCSQSGSTHKESDHTSQQASSFTHAGEVYPGIFRWSRSSGLSVVADPSIPVPLGSAGEAFVGFSDPAIGSDGTAAFVASTGGALGVFASDPSSGRLSAVATTSTPVPGASGMFGNFPYVPSVGEDGSVLFYGSAGTQSGVYSGVPSSSDSSPWTIQAELTLADKVQGHSLQYIGFGTCAYSQVTNIFATYLVLDNGVDGVWTFNRKSRRDRERLVLV